MIRVICPLLKKKKKKNKKKNKKKKKKKLLYMYLTLFTQSPIICKYRPVSTKLGQNIYVQQNLHEFDHGSEWTRTTGVICS